MLKQLSAVSLLGGYAIGGPWYGAIVRSSGDRVTIRPTVIGARECLLWIALCLAFGAGLLLWALYLGPKADRVAEVIADDLRRDLGARGRR